MTRLLSKPIVSQSGSALALALIALLVLSGVALSLGSLSLINRDAARRDESSTRAAYIARAGMERACADVLNNSQQWSLLTPGTIFSAEPFGGGFYDVSILSSTTDKVVLLVTTTVGGQTNEFEVDILRRTTLGNSTGATMGASLGPPRNLGLGLVNQNENSPENEDDEDDDDNDSDGD